MIALMIYVCFNGTRTSVIVSFSLATVQIGNVTNGPELTAF